MSVDRRRLAAAQRTAVGTNPTRARRLGAWILLLLIRYIFVPLRARDKLLGLFAYMLFYECCMYWLNLWALFTVKNRSWVTRASTAQA